MEIIDVLHYKMNFEYLNKVAGQAHVNSECKAYRDKDAIRNRQLDVDRSTPLCFVKYRLNQQTRYTKVIS